MSIDDGYASTADEMLKREVAIYGDRSHRENYGIGRCKECATLTAELAQVKKERDELSAWKEQAINAYPQLEEMKL